ncbi:ExeM/NucH family extracellular endonuclease [Vibrio sp. HN007]|uniref:ExeM/NucH family extracellular endonuclease n=1 Tax=Vibrio iocasae TaxID=3098914 RepID=UPI0035D4578C
MDNKYYRKTLIATAIALASSTVSAEVLISQYVEGGASNKALEIANAGESSETLTGYELKLFSNGAAETSKVIALDSVTLAAGEAYVFANSNAAQAIQDVADVINNSVINFNGDDAVALYKDGVLIDVIGTIGERSNWAKDVTLVRNESVTTPNSTYSPGEWTDIGKDVFTGLGEYGETTEPDPGFQCQIDGAEPTYTAIYDIQGDADSSPLSGSKVYVKGVVAAVTNSLTKGFYLHSISPDNDAKTSDGIFVYTNETSSQLQPGDVVCAYGEVKEYWGLTQLAVRDQSYVALEGQGQGAPAAVEMEIIGSDESMDDTFERYEGMLVKLNSELDMRVSRTFSYDYAGRRNNMVLAQGRPNPQPNQIFVPGSEEANTQSEENAQKRLYVESDHKAANGEIPYYPEFGRTDADADGSTEDYIRIDDRVVGLEGVMTYSFGEYRLIATNTLDQNNFVHLTPREEEPELYKGDLRIATFNVLNYFNSPFGGDANQFGSSRGAGTQEEFELQEAKIVQAILRMDADIVGLMEIENNGFGENSAIQRLLDAVNSQIDKKKKRYKFVAIDSNNDGVTDALDSVGTDAIAVGVFYRPKVVKLLDPRVISMPAQQAPEVVDGDGKVIEDGKNYQRDSIAPTFKVKGVSGYRNNNKLTIAVNHFKSKGSKCWEDAAAESAGGQGGKDADRQGSCENFRVAAAVALGDAMASIEGHKVIVGDLNSYAKEDPMLVLTNFNSAELGRDIKAARNTFIDGVEQFGDNGAVITESYGYTDVMALLHDDTTWSYSYNDEVGSLDHILVSESLAYRVVDAADWHINAAESSLFEYGGKYTGDLPKYADQYRSSDHDPAIVELDIKGGSVGIALLLGLGGLGVMRSRKR